MSARSRVVCALTNHPPDEFEKGVPENSEEYLQVLLIIATNKSHEGTDGGWPLL